MRRDEVNVGKIVVFQGIGFGYEARAAFASDPASSRGRLVPQSHSATRTEFQRDRDRIIHSSAFRRLKHKTQVFVSDEGDHYRTRLTHTIEVAQIARSLARAFRLDEDLAEAVALVHDFGHTPFGHAGERALDRKMKDFGGFEHNAQSLRIVTSLERRYAGFDGLNLTWETLEGLVKHNGPLLDRSGRSLEGTLPPTIVEFDRRFPLELTTYASLEAQAAAIADDIAYNAHDIDDGLRAGVLDLDQLKEAPLVADILAQVQAAYPDLDRGRTIGEVVRRQITLMVEDVVAEAAVRLEALEPLSVADVRHAGQVTVTFSEQMSIKERALKDWLYRSLYRHSSIMEKMDDAGRIVEELFDAYLQRPLEMGDEWFMVVAGASQDMVARQVSDYLSGMTDNFALKEHTRLFDRKFELG
jgi:dGTPase